MRTSASLIAVVVALWSGSARALDSDTFQPSGSFWDAQGTLQLAHPALGHPGAAYVAAGLVWADDPVVVVHPDGTTDPVVHTLLATRLAAGYTLLGRARLDLQVPLYPVADAPGLDATGATTGDLRIGALVPLMTADAGRPGLALAPAVRMPTGDPARYTGTDGVGFAITAAAAGGGETTGWTLNAGADFGKASTLGDLELGSAVLLGAGLHRDLTDMLLVGGELTGRLTVTGGVGSFERNPVEAHLYGQWGGVGPLLVSAGAGTGLVAGVGAPDVRLFAAAGWRGAGTPPVYDRDKDGFTDDTDRCPDEPEDIDAFEDEDGCPEPDNDRDRVPDLTDPCPRQAEDVDGFMDSDGCPDPDNDGDKVLDAEDRCPEDRGTPATLGCPDLDADGVDDATDNCVDVPGPKATRGCPDRDADLVPDKRDKCPDQAKDPRADPERSDGCPARVIVTREKIEILDKIHFATGKAVIMKDSFPLLADIAAVMNANPDLALIEVAGHTDDVGNDAANLKLSQARAEAVAAHLVKIGKVAPERLQARGYGETKPMADNATPEGKAQNRRVEFVIVRR